MRTRLASFLLILTFLAAPLFAQKLRTEMVVSTDWLARHLEYAVVLDVGDARSFDLGHIPGARLLEFDRIVTTRHRVPNELPDVEVLEHVFTSIGTGDRGRIILYSRNPLQAARAWFTLDSLGHGSRTAILDGGYAKWMNEGRPLEQGQCSTEPLPFHARLNSSAVASLKVMRDIVKWRHVLGSPYTLIDARPSDQYHGREESPDPRHGHIPGAVNVPWTENVTFGDISRLLPEAELRETYRAAGVNPKSANIVYCRTGIQASLTYFVLKYLGYDATLYDGSFSEWSASAETLVVEQGQGPSSGVSR
jgi:thiosulfate/3-mercaptopyruvate sulfurtransferase